MHASRVPGWQQPTIKCALLMHHRPKPAVKAQMQAERAAEIERIKVGAWLGVLTSDTL